MEKKSLIIFDFDETLVDMDSLEFQVSLLKTEEERKKVLKMDQTENWTKSFGYFYSRLKEEGVTLEQLRKKLKEIVLTDGMKELFDYLKQNKKKYTVIFLSGNVYHIIDYVLLTNDMRDPVDDIFCCFSRVSEEEDKIIVLPREISDCASCNPAICKSQELQKYLQKHGRENLDKIFFVCDGGNDFCLSKALGEQDICFPRKDHKLAKKLFDDGFKKEVKCKIMPWRNGMEIIEALKGLEI